MGNQPPEYFRRNLTTNPHSNFGDVLTKAYPDAGGRGATLNLNSQSGMVPADEGETSIMPVEVRETRFPILVEQFCFNTTQPAEPG